MCKLNPKAVEKINISLETAELTVQEYMKLYKKTITYDTFILNYIKLNRKLQLFDLGDTLAWLEDHRGKEIDIISSGSLLMCLLDFNTLITPWGEDELNEEEWNYAECLHDSLLSVYQTWASNEKLL